jgi:50S ribosomal protein L16 3-hydroxylase
MARCDGLRLDRRSRMLWRDRLIFINGESVAVDSSSRRLLRQLAGRRMLDARTLAALDDAHPLFDLLRGWLAAGWIVPGAAA